MTFCMSTQPRTLTSQRRGKKRVTNSNSILRRITGLERLLPHKLRTQTSEKLDTYTQAHDSFVFLVVWPTVIFFAPVNARFCFH